MAKLVYIRSFRTRKHDPRRSPERLYSRRRTLPRWRRSTEPRCRACRPSSWPDPRCPRAAAPGPTCWTGSARPRRPAWRRTGLRPHPSGGGQRNQKFEKFTSEGSVNRWKWINSIWFSSKCQTTLDEPLWNIQVSDTVQSAEISPCVCVCDWIIKQQGPVLDSKRMQYELMALCGHYSHVTAHFLSIREAVMELTDRATC